MDMSPSRTKHNGETLLVACPWLHVERGKGVSHWRRVLMMSTLMSTLTVWSFFVCHRMPTARRLLEDELHGITGPHSQGSDWRGAVVPP